VTLLDAFRLALSLHGADRRRSSRLGVGWRGMARFAARTPSGDSWCCECAKQRLLTTSSAIRRQIATQLVRARHSFGRHQNCTAGASGLRPALDRGSRAQRLRLIRSSVSAVFPCDRVTLSSCLSPPPRTAFSRPSRSLPDDVTLDEAIEKRCFSAKVERGLSSFPDRVTR